MNYHLIKELIQCVEEFDTTASSQAYSKDLAGFKKWICTSESAKNGDLEEPEWEGKEDGRTPESLISTLLVHMNRYAKSYSKSAIHDSPFSSQEDFIYLINLKAFGAMSKMDLIKKNIQEKPTGMLIINRLIEQGWVIQSDSLADRRSKIITITEKGLFDLEKVMNKIRHATEIVSGNLTYQEKIKLIKLLQKLDNFHNPIYTSHIGPAELVDTAYNDYLRAN
jgi:DNA-binding MarR family transcriptional regulator